MKIFCLESAGNSQPQTYGGLSRAKTLTNCCRFRLSSRSMQSCFPSGSKYRQIFPATMGKSASSNGVSPRRALSSSPQVQLTRIRISRIRRMGSIRSIDSGPTVSSPIQEILGVGLTGTTLSTAARLRTQQGQLQSSQSQICRLRTSRSLYTMGRGRANPSGAWLCPS